MHKTRYTYSADDAAEPHTDSMKEQIAPLPPATTAPDFTAQHTLSQRLSLRGLGVRPIVVVFFPFAWEPVSGQQLALYQEYLREIEGLGASLLAISVDHIWSLRAFARVVQLRFPLLSDARPRGAIARLYGVYREEEERSARALFVLDCERVIRFSQVYPDALNPGVNDILTILMAAPHT